MNTFTALVIGFLKTEKGINLRFFAFSGQPNRRQVTYPVAIVAESEALVFFPKEA